MNRCEYNTDPRYAKVLEKMDLLGIMDITTTRQSKNGTIVWKLPIKDQDSKLHIEVASFKSGYVRNQGVSCHSNYQLNKRCESEPDYYEVERDGLSPLYRKFTTRTCKLIPIEIDRLEYLISYCLKNYYIKNANQVPNGNYIPKWKHENALKQIATHTMNCKNGYQLDLQNKLEKANSQIKKLDDFYEASKAFNDSMYEGRNDRVKDLEDKLDKAEKNEFYPYSMEIRVNGQKYKVI